MGPVAPRHVGSSQTRARTCVPCIGRQILNHCATREAPKRAFKRGQGWSAARKGAGLHFQVTGGVRSGLDGSVGWATEASTVNCRQHSFPGPPAEQVWLLEPDSRDDACRLLQGLLPGQGTVLAGCRCPAFAPDVKCPHFSTLPGGRSSWAAAWAESLSTHGDLPAASGCTTHPQLPAAAAGYSQLGDVSASWPAGAFPSCQDFQEHSWDGW